jgi:hypothetical protein
MRVSEDQILHRVLERWARRKYAGGWYGGTDPTYAAIMEVYDEIPMRTAQHLRIKGNPRSYTTLELEHASGNHLSLHFDVGTDKYVVYVNRKRRPNYLQNPRNLATWLDQVFRGIWDSMVR